MFTVKEILEKLKGQFDDYEVYRYTGKRKIIHTDFIESVTNIDLEDDGIDFNAKVIEYEVMGETDYNNTVYAGNSTRADFQEWFDDRNFKILVIIIE